MEGERRPTVRLKTGAWFIPAMADARPGANSPRKAPLVRLRPRSEDEDAGDPLRAFAAA